jgi:P27 family predicted phage terminase small subunit
MGRRGPKPTPNHLKVIRGDEEARLNRDEPVPSNAASPIAPPSISEGAAKVWDRLAPDMIDKKMLTEWDVDAFVVFCEAVATYHDCRLMMGKDYVAAGAAGGVIKSPYWQIMRDCSAIMAQFSSRFGMTPGDRASLKAGMDEDSGPKSGAERILG